MKEALANPDKAEWENAMEEIKLFYENDVWDLVELPKDRKAVGCLSASSVLMAWWNGTRLDLWLRVSPKSPD